MMLTRIRGFTLIELMVAVVIVAILAAIAIPSYSSMMRKARRSDAIDALLLVQAQQEKWRANNATFGTLANINVNATSNEGYYTIAVASNTATGYVATATALNSTDQFSDTTCRVLRLTVSAANPRGQKSSTNSAGTTVIGANSTCWD